MKHSCLIDTKDSENVIARSVTVARRSRSKLGDSSLRSEQAPQSLTTRFLAEPALSETKRFFASLRMTNEGFGMTILEGIFR